MHNYDTATSQQQSCGAKQIDFYNLYSLNEFFCSLTDVYNLVFKGHERGAPMKTEFTAII